MVTGTSFLYSMELSLRIINKIKGAPRKQKAVAIALCLKHVSGRDSIIRNVNPNKIHTLIGISPNTFTTYLPLMLDMGSTGNCWPMNS